MNMEDRILRLASDVIRDGIFYHELTDNEKAEFEIHISCAEDFIADMNDLVDHRKRLRLKNDER